MTYTPPFTHASSASGAAERTTPAVNGQTHALLARFGRWCGGVLKASQYGQMVRVLHQMPDDTLAEIGISRSEISDYARSLIDGG